MLTRFIIYGLLGWVMEILFTGFISGLNGNPRLIGQTYLWMFPIYGLAIALEPLHNLIRPLPWYLRGTIWVPVIWTLELITGGVIRTLIGTSPWVYRDGWHILGLIRLEMAPLWFGVGLIFEQVHDWLTSRQFVFLE